MASSHYLAENIVGAQSDDDFGLSDKDKSEGDRGSYICGYLGSLFFMPAKLTIKDPEFQPNEKELTANEVRRLSTEKEEYRHYNIWFPATHKGEISQLATGLHTADLTIG